MNRVGLLVTTMMLSFSTAAQQMDSLLVPTVSISAERIVPITGTKTTTLDSSLVEAFSATRLADLLRLNGMVNIRSYGPSGSANLSIRGTGPQHSLLLWNGIPLTDGMLGQSDVSLIPNSVVGSVSVHHGPGSLEFQPGGLGGAVELTTGFLSDTGLSVSISGSIGSFQNYGGQLAVSHFKGRWKTATSLSYQTGKNEFPYVNIATREERIAVTENAALVNYGGSHSSRINLGNGHQLSLHALGTFTDRRLPPTMLTVDADASQSDLDILGAAEWAWKNDRTELSWNLSYLHSHQQFSLSDSSYRFHHFHKMARSMMRYKHFLASDLSVKVGLDVNFESARSDSAYLRQVRHRHGESIFISLKHQPKKWISYQVLFREDLVSNNPSPFQWSAGFSLNPLKTLAIKANFARNFRPPSLNELYWFPYGNPDIRSETGLSYEVGTAYHTVRKKLRLEAEITWFDSWVNNWVIWITGPDGLLSPENKKLIRASGVEAMVKAVGKVGKVNLGGQVNYTFNRSIIKDSFEGDQAIGNQLLYVPLHSVNINLQVDWKYLSFMYGQTLVSERPTNAENEQFMDAYTLGWISASAKLPISRHAIQLGCRLDNLWNTQYQLIPWRPMPGINYQLTLKYQFS